MPKKYLTIEEAEIVKQDIETTRLMINLEGSIGYTYEEVTKLLS